MFRIYDSCLANGIEAIFSFSIQLLRKNEEKLLKMKFDEMLAFLNTKLLDAYKVRPSPSFTLDQYELTCNSYHLKTGRREKRTSADRARRRQTHRGLALGGRAPRKLPQSRYNVHMSRDRTLQL